MFGHHSKSKVFLKQSRYSSLVSHFQAKTGIHFLAIYAAA
jgi:hypothetical protein